MTKEEAKNILKDYRVPELKAFDVDKFDEAVDMAIKALEQGNVPDKIRAEIFNACSDNYHMPVYELSCEEIFEIIDKHLAEVKE